MSSGRYAHLWERMLAFLSGWVAEVEESPAGLTVTFVTPSGSARRVEVVMSHDDWDSLVTVPWGDFDAAAKDLRRALLSTDEAHPYLVYNGTYELVPSAGPALPPDPDDARLEELLRRHPEGFGRWVVRDEDGNVVDELGPERPA